MASESWEQYRLLVTSELERNDKNIQEVLKAVTETNSKLASIETSLDNIKNDFKQASSREKKLEVRMLSLEKDFSSLKTKVIMIGGFVATAVSIGASFLIKLAGG